ncbi:hypothetical protein ACIBQX_47905 [Nonomuraea sp. NPDC049714]|uniref:hypothetical protein n=1 Tax=Nonomuraea sp. NPDC049714 TaxID=3364357 RepID=UPI0037AE52CB
MIAAGVTADVTFSAPGKKCADDRFTSADPAYGKIPEGMGTAKLWDDAKNWRSRKAIRPVSMHEFKIYPRHMKPGETLVLEFRDNQNPRQPWQLGGWPATAETPVKPCVAVDDTAPIQENP